MNSILEYTNVMALRKCKYNDGIKNKVCNTNVSDVLDIFKKGRDIVHDSLITEHVNDEQSNHILDDLNNVSNNNVSNNDKYIQNEYTKSERLDVLFHKLHRLEFIDTNGCIMVKPPKLMRNSRIDSTNNVVPFCIITFEEKIAKFEEKITLLEKSLNHEEIISLYENRLNKLENYIICKNQSGLYNEN